MRWNTKCICFKKLAETSWSKKNLKECVPKRSSKDGWRAKETFPSGSPFVTFVIRSCDMALNFDGYPELPGSTRLGMSECRNVLVNALVKVTGTVRRSDLITSACTILQFPNSSLHGVLLNVDGTPRFTCNSMPTPKNPEQLQCAFQNWSHSWFLLVCIQSVIFYCFSNRSM